MALKEDIAQMVGSGMAALVLGGERHRSISTRHKWAGRGDTAGSRTAMVPALQGLAVPQDGETTNTSHLWRGSEGKAYNVMGQRILEGVGREGPLKKHIEGSTYSGFLRKGTV